MNLPLFFFLIILAVILAQSNHGFLALVLGGLAIAWLVIAPWLEHQISAHAHLPRSSPSARRGPMAKKKRSGRG